MTVPPFPDVPVGDEESSAVGAAPTAAPPEALLAAAGDANKGDNGDDGDNVCFEAETEPGPTEAMLRKAIREAVITAVDTNTITQKQV